MGTHWDAAGIHEFGEHFNLVNLLVPYHVPCRGQGEAEADKEIHHLAPLAHIEVVDGVVIIPIATATATASVPSPTAASSSTVVALAYHERVVVVQGVIFRVTGIIGVFGWLGWPVIGGCPRTAPTAAAFVVIFIWAILLLSLL